MEDSSNMAAITPIAPQLIASVSLSGQYKRPNFDGFAINNPKPGSLWYKLSDYPRPIISRPDGSALSAFRLLENASDDKILEFALTWGPLGIHAFHTSATPPGTQVHVAVGQGYLETLGAYRNFAVLIKWLSSMATCVANGGEINRVDWGGFCLFVGSELMVNRGSPTVITDILKAIDWTMTEAFRGRSNRKTRRSPARNAITFVHCLTSFSSIRWICDMIQKQRGSSR